MQIWPKLPGPGPAHAGGSGHIHTNQVPRKELLAACQATTLPKNKERPGLPCRNALGLNRNHLLPNGLTSSQQHQTGASSMHFFPFHLDMACNARSAPLNKMQQLTGTGH